MFGFDSFSGFTEWAGGIAQDLQPVADLYGSVTGDTLPDLSLGTPGFTPGFVPAGTTSTSPATGPVTDSWEAVQAKEDALKLLIIGVIVLFLFTRN